MIKKLFFVLMTSSLILFFSCGSTKQENPKTEISEAPLLTEENPEEAAPEIQEEGLIQNQTEEDSDQQENSDQEESREESQEEETTEASAQEDLDSLYPALEEIEEEEFIDLPYEEAQNKELEEKEIEEAQKAELTEPVTEAEVLPPLPEGTDDTDQESNAETDQNAETDSNAVPDPNAVLAPAEGEETPIEPTIEIQEEPEEEIEILPSRSVSLKKGETLVITYPGNGWIYMGSTSEYNNLASRGRKLGTTDTKYTLLAKEAGTQIHHFYKVDNLTGQYIDDYIEVTVLEKKGNSSTVVNAPAYSEVVPKKPETPAKASPKAKETPQSNQQESTVTPVEEKKTEVQASVQKEDKEDSVIEVEREDSVIVIDEDEEETEENTDLEALLDKARSSIKANKNDDAYPLLVQYLEFSTDNRDEALYLLGQILESNSKYRDIKQAVETYQTLCDSYPASPYWDKANKRIVYLKRFYINIH